VESYIEALKQLK